MNSKDQIKDSEQRKLEKKKFTSKQANKQFPSPNQKKKKKKENRDRSEGFLERKKKKKKR